MSEDGYEGVTHAGIACVCRAQGVVLLAQRAFDADDDPEVRESWEFPGGSLEDGEDAQAGAFREFEEEIGLPLDRPGNFDRVVGGWRSDDGVYQGFIVDYATPRVLDFFEPNDEVQAVEWFTREKIEQMENLRPEVRGTDWDLIFGVSGNEDDMDSDDAEFEPMAEDDTDFDSIFALPIPVHGVIAPEEVETGDRRAFAAGSMTARPGRLAFRWAESDIGAHDGAVTVGSVDRMMRKDGLIHWEGRLMPSAKADDFADLMEFFDGRYGVSVDGDNGNLDAARTNETGVAWFDAVRASALTAVAIPAFAEAYVAFGPHPEMPAAGDETDALVASGDLVKFDRGPGWVTNPDDTRRIHRYWTEKGQPGYEKVGWGTPGDFRRAKALIGEKILKNSPDKARFLNQIIAQWHFDALGYWPGDLGKPGNAPDTPENRRRAARHAAATEMPDGIVASEDETSAWEAVLTASGSGKKPPVEYFHRHPDAYGTVITEPDENGFRRTYGYAAEWGVCHIGYENQCVEPPRTYSDDYVQFHKGHVNVEGGRIPTGVLTYNVEHRSAQRILTESATQAHFDNLKNAWAAVRIGEDETGIWFSGIVLPKIPEEDLVKIAASGQVSGEWKHGALRALLTVNVEGFEITRASAEYDEAGNVVALAASAFGQVKDSPCAPTPAERMAALREVERQEKAAARLAALRAGR